MMWWCRQRDIDGKKDFPLGAVMGELDWYCELMHVLYEDEHATNGCVCCKGERMSGTNEFGTPYDQTSFPNKTQHPNERQVGGAHYRKNTAYQHWDLVADTGMNYYTAQVTKYLTRWRSKNGAEDVRKALHYCDKLISLREEGRAPLCSVAQLFAMPNCKAALDKFYQFVDEQGLSKDETIIFEQCISYQSQPDLLRLRENIQQLLTRIEEGTFGQTTHL